MDRPSGRKNYIRQHQRRDSIDVLFRMEHMMRGDEADLRFNKLVKKEKMKVAVHDARETSDGQGQEDTQTHVWMSCYRHRQLVGVSCG